MGGTVASLIPLMVGAAAAPIWIIIVLLLLRGSRGVLTAAAFVAGMTVVRLAQGGLFGFILRRAGHDGADERSIASILLLVVGLLMLVAGARKVFSDEDPDAPPPKWMSLLGQATPLAALGFGAALLLIGAKQWVFTLGAIGVIRETDLSRPERIVAFLIFVAGAQILLVLPIVLSVLAPSRTGAALDRASGWLERNNRPIMIAVSFIFGLYFVVKSLSSLL
ncbi:MAG: GAP family protein [Thermomicrobiales bacterium]|nr:GAP family protein [Thermomicrobiales bacterium]